MDIKNIKDAKAGEPFEYFCRGCLQLRLSFCELGRKFYSCGNCGNCGSHDLVIGALGTLDKEKLKQECQ